MGMKLYVFHFIELFVNIDSLSKFQMKSVMVYSFNSTTNR